MSVNQSPAVDHLASYSINRGRWLDQDDAEHEIEEIDEDEALPLPTRYGGWAVPVRPQEVRR